MTAGTVDRRHPPADRRAPISKMARLIAASAGCAADLEAFPGDPGVAYLVAARIGRINDELGRLKARDLLAHRTVTP